MDSQKPKFVEIELRGRVNVTREWEGILKWEDSLVTVQVWENGVLLSTD